MNIKSLLYPIHDRNLSEDHSQITDLSLAENKHLTMVAFAESLPIPLMTAGQPEAAEGWARNMALAESQLQSSTSELEEKLNTQDLRVDVRGELGDGMMIDEVISKHASCSDLALMKRRAGNVESTFFERLCHGVLFLAGKPVLIFNQYPPESFNFKNILLAWDGKRAANRAVAEALPLLKQAESVHLLCVNAEKTLLARSEEPAWDISTYLALHQVPVTLHILESEDHSISQIIKKQAENINADLIVSGAYGHSRLRERIFGGTTKELLENCDVPLLMAH